VDRIEAMTTLLAVVEAGSLSAASRKLGVPLPTVSRRVSELEAHLKTQTAQPIEPPHHANRRCQVLCAGLPPHP